MKQSKGMEDSLRILLVSARMEYQPMFFARNMLVFGLMFGASTVLFLIGGFDAAWAIFAGIAAFAAFELVVYSLLFVAADKRISAIEAALPEFLSLMASNIRSGHTYDRALLLSARKEFGPLSEEIDKVAKETFTGKPLAEALIDMTKRVPSSSFEKTINLVVKGLNSGGKLADLLDATALDIRRFGSIKKEVQATVLVYQLFSFAAVCFGAPMLYAITTFLVQVFAEARGKIGSGAVSDTSLSMPFFQGASISPDLTFLFSLAAIAVTVFFGALAGGVIAKGEERDGLVYLPVLAVVSFGVYFLVSYLLNVFLGGFFFGSS